jgi:hypothetical protein
MKTGTQHLPVILLLGKRMKTNDDVDRWLENSRFSAHEATNVFQALEDISDFTVRDVPDVVYCHVDRIDAEMQMLQTMLLTTAGDSCASVLAFPDSEPQSEFGKAERLGGLERTLDRLIPCSPQVN